TQTARTEPVSCCKLEDCYLGGTLACGSVGNGCEHRLVARVCDSVIEGVFEAVHRPGDRLEVRKLPRNILPDRFLFFELGYPVFKPCKVNAFSVNEVLDHLLCVKAA